MILWQSQEVHPTCLIPKPERLRQNAYFQWLPLEAAGCKSCPYRALALVGTFSYHGVGWFYLSPLPTFTPSHKYFTGINIQKPISRLSKKTWDLQKLLREPLDYLFIMLSSEIKTQQTFLYNFGKQKGKNPQNYLLLVNRMMLMWRMTYQWQCHRWLQHSGCCVPFLQTCTVLFVAKQFSPSLPQG